LLAFGCGAGHNCFPGNGNAEALAKKVGSVVTPGIIIAFLEKLFLTAALAKERFFQLPPSLRTVLAVLKLQQKISLCNYGGVCP
jgi:hypothetical protein